jgi:hypothetical protein
VPPPALGAALRVAGLIEGGERGLALLEEAVQMLSESPAKLGHAKARTELGAALRRANRRSGAREQLRQAVELATTCGAAPLAARGESELLATGARPRRIAVSGVESLTPSERRVADDQRLPEPRDQLAFATCGRARRTGRRPALFDDSHLQ